MKHIHQHNMYHRDLKPANIMLLLPGVGCKGNGLFSPSNKPTAWCRVQIHGASFSTGFALQDADGIHDGAGVDTLAIRDVSSGVAEFMVDGARVEARPCVWRHQWSGRVHG
jgi:serine/threonine protein kinase